MIRLSAAFVFLLAAACASSTPPDAAPGRGAVALDRSAAAMVAMAADEVMRMGLAERDPALLAQAFAGHALQALRDQLRWMRERGLSLEERDPRRSLVSWDGARDEVVIQVEAQERLVSMDQPDPPWSGTVHERWSRLGFVDHGWRVVDVRDLAPDQWAIALTTRVLARDGPL